MVRVMASAMVGLTPGFIKRSPVAWYASHRHGTDGGNEIYNYSYLFAYTINVPPGAKTLTLPLNDDASVFSRLPQPQPAIQRSLRNLYMACLIPLLVSLITSARFGGCTCCNDPLRRTMQW